MNKFLFKRLERLEPVFKHNLTATVSQERVRSARTWMSTVAVRFFDQLAIGMSAAVAAVGMEFDWFGCAISGFVLING